MSLFCDLVIHMYVLFSFAIILLRKRDGYFILIIFMLSCVYIFVFSVFQVLFCIVLLVDLKSGFVAFPDQTYCFCHSRTK